MISADPVAVPPARRASVSVALPGSKSYTHRALVAAALASGESVIRNPSRSTDALRMAGALRDLGARIDDGGGSFTVRGAGGIFRPGDRTIDVGNAGTVLRFVTALAALVPGVTTVTGDDDLLRRPVGALVRAMREAGIDASCRGGFPPVVVRGNGLRRPRRGEGDPGTEALGIGSPGGGVLRGGVLRLDNPESSQFLSALLLVAPFADSPLTVEAAGSLRSAPYVAMTAAVMREFGVSCDVSGGRFAPRHGARYSPAARYDVEPDLSAAAIFAAAAAVTRAAVRFPGLPPETLQGDARALDLLGVMGCAVERSGDGVSVTGGPLRGIDAEMGDIPDAVPPLAVTAAFAAGPTRIRNVGHLRHKETDRLSALETELRRIGAEATADGDDFVVVPRPLRAATIETYNDHRIAMSFAVAGLALGGMRIVNPGCVEKSFPRFWDELGKFT